MHIFLTLRVSLNSGGAKPAGGKVVSPADGGCPRCGQRVYDAEKAIGCPGVVSYLQHAMFPSLILHRVLYTTLRFDFFYLTS